jgi:catalase
MNKAQQKALFENTARAVANAPDFIKQRQNDYWLKADPACGEGAAAALGLAFEKAR